MAALYPVWCFTWVPPSKTSSLKVLDHGTCMVRLQMFLSFFFYVSIFHSSFENRNHLKNGFAARFAIDWAGVMFLSEFLCRSSGFTIIHHHPSSPSIIIMIHHHPSSPIIIIQHHHHHPSSSIIIIHHHPSTITPPFNGISMGGYPPCTIPVQNL